jgi:hypothetical protein
LGSSTATANSPAERSFTSSILSSIAAAPRRWSKQYFPLVVNLFAAVGMKSDIALNFLSRWPTLHELRKAKTHTVRSFFYAHNSRSQSLIEKGFNK